MWKEAKRLEMGLSPEGFYEGGISSTSNAFLPPPSPTPQDERLNNFIAGWHAALGVPMTDEQANNFGRVCDVLA